MTTSTFANLPLASLHESPLNPRQRFDPAAMAELAASIAAHGIITPLLVRQNGAGYEIAAGHRRYRAAQLAGLTEAPAVVRTMTDVEFLEILVMENDQREDVHPLEEARGYETLRTKAKYDVATIAARVGRSVKYVYDRLKLLSLTKEAQRLFLADRFTAGHAILLARLTAADQTRLIDPDGYQSGLWQRQQHLLRDPDADDGDEDPYADLKPVSVRELEAYIADHVRFDVDRVDPILFPETLAELTTAREEEEKIVKITYDGFVQADARSLEERTYCVSSWARADGKQGSKPCDRSVTGVIVVGFGRGEAFKVCVNKDKCRVHWGQEIKAREKRAEARAEGTPLPQQARHDQDEEERKRREAQERREEAERERWKKATPAILVAVANRVKTMPTKADGFLAQVILREMNIRIGGKTAQLVPPGGTAEGLIRHLAFLALVDRVNNSWMAPRDFPKVAKSIGLDLTKVLDEAAPIETPKAETKACTVCGAAGIDPTAHVCTPAALKKAKRHDRKTAKAVGKKTSKRKKARAA